MPDLTGKTYVITGATAGTGKEAAKHLIAQGAHVVMLNRNPDKSQGVIEAIQSDFQNHVRDHGPPSHRPIRNARGLSPTDVRH